METLTIYGASDDLVEAVGIEGADEFSTNGSWRGVIEAPDGGTAMTRKETQMTDNKIDRAAEAIRLLEQNGPVGQAADGSWAAAICAEAQVHATLALVEQQRITNLIALASLRVGPGDLLVLRNLVIEPRDEHSVQPTAEIREALGL